MTMDERQWSKARNLASAYSEAYDEDVALVLSEALLEALAELLVPEGERDFGSLTGPEQQAVRDAQAQHPAYLPPVLHMFNPS